MRDKSTKVVVEFTATSANILEFTATSANNLVKTMTMTKTKTMTKTNTFREHLQRAILETCDLFVI